MRATGRWTAPLLGVWLAMALALPPLWRMDCLLTGMIDLGWVEVEACMPNAAAGIPDCVAPGCCDFSHVEAEHTSGVRPVLDVQGPPHGGWFAEPGGELLLAVSGKERRLVLHARGDPPEERLPVRLARLGCYLL